MRIRGLSERDSGDKSRNSDLLNEQIDALRRRRRLRVSLDRRIDRRGEIVRVRDLDRLHRRASAFAVGIHLSSAIRCNESRGWYAGSALSHCTGGSCQSIHRLAIDDVVGMIVLKQKASLHYGLPPPPAPQPPSPWSSILWGDDRRPRGRRRVACGARVTQLREKVTAKVSSRAHQEAPAKLLISEFGRSRQLSAVPLVILVILVETSERESESCRERR